MSLELTSIDKANLTSRASNALHRANIHTIGDMLALDEEQLASFSNVGRKTIDEVLLKIAEYKKMIANENCESDETNRADDIVISDNYLEWTLNEGKEYIQQFLKQTEAHVSQLSLLQPRTYNLLIINDYVYIYQIVSASIDELMQIPRMTVNAAEEIIKACSYFLSENEGEIREYIKQLNDRLAEQSLSLSGNSKKSYTIWDYFNMPDYSDIIMNFVKNNDIDITKLGLSNRPKNRLREQGYEYLSDILFLSADELQRIPAMGNGSVAEILDAISNYLRKYEKRIIAVISGDESAMWDDLVIRDRILRLYINNPFGGYSLNEFKEGLELPNFVTDERLKKIIGLLIAEKKLEYVDFRCYRLYISFEEFITKCEGLDKRDISCIEKRLSGETLEAISKDFGVTRERIRQIIEKAVGRVHDFYVNTIGDEYFDEDYYTYFFKTYEIDKNEAIEWLGISLSVFKYMEMSGINKGKKSIDEALTDGNLDVGLRIKIKNYIHRNQVLIDGKWVEKNRSALEAVAVKHICQDEISFENFGQKYNEYLESVEIAYDEKIYYTKEVLRTRENKLSSSRYLLWKQNRKLRYYDIDSQDYEELLDILQLDNYENTEISTLKFMNDYPEVMDRYDIRDQYELHNLLKKIIPDGSYHDISFPRMPIISFGTFDRVAAFFELMINNAPISYSGLCTVIRDEYGFEQGSVTDALDKFSEYYHNGIFDIEQKLMSSENLAKLKSLLTEDFYLIAEIKEMYKDTVSNADEDEINSYNLKLIGFDVASKYVLRNYQSFDKYVEHILTEKDIVDISSIKKRMCYIQGYSQKFMQLRRNLDIIEFEPGKIINIRKLEDYGISRDKLYDFCDDVYNWVHEGQYFSINKIIKDGFTSDIFDLGFSEMFYANILLGDDRFSCQSMFGNIIIYKGKRKISIKDFLSNLIKKERVIDIYDLLNMLVEEYGCKVKDRYDLVYKVADTAIYYDKILERFYLNQDAYYQELEEKGGL